MFELAVLVISGIVNLLLGMTVYLKNPKSATGRLFLLLTVSFVLWSTTNYISLHPFFFSQVVWVRLVLVCAALLCLVLFLTFTTFPALTMQGSKRIRKLAIYSTGFVMLWVLTPFVFTTNAHGDPVPNPGIVLFAILVVCLLAGSVITLVQKIRHSRGVVHSQLKLVLAGVAVTLGLIFISNFLLVVVFDYRGLLLLGPAYTLIFSSTIAYAIVRHRLFDIRAAVARSVAYILIVATMSLLYSVILFGGINLLFQGANKEVQRQLLSIALVVPLAVSFQYIKRFFDRVSSRIFYRVFYDPQQVLNELSTLLVHSLDIKDVKNGSAQILRGATTATQLIYVLKADTSKEAEYAQLLDRLFARGSGESVILIDEYVRHPDIVEKLREQNIAAVVRLRTNAGDLGYMTLGFKDSGEIYSPQDVQLLKIAADEIAISLQNAIHFEAIQKFNETLQEKIQHATHELRRTNEKLKALDETKDDFISMASHQLRTPLTSVKGYLSMVLEGDAGKLTATERKMLTQAYTSSQRMVYLIADLLNVSRLKTGKFIIDATPTDLSKIINEEIDQLVEAATSRNLTLTYDPPKDFPVVMLDETKIRQVIMNFIDNAIYYTPNGGHIRIELNDTGPMVELRVVDDGIGVTKAEQHHLFTKFYRAGNARKARPDGTGLGLFMAKKVIAAQGGALLFESTEGKGSTFGFTFSKSKLAAPAAIVNTVSKPAKPASKTEVTKR